MSANLYIPYLAESQILRQISHDPHETPIMWFTEIVPVAELPESAKRYTFHYPDDSKHAPLAGGDLVAVASNRAAHAMRQRTMDVIHAMLAADWESRAWTLNLSKPTEAIKLMRIAIDTVRGFATKMIDGEFTRPTGLLVLVCNPVLAQRLTPLVPMFVDRLCEPVVDTTMTTDGYAIPDDTAFLVYRDNPPRDRPLDSTSTVRLLCRRELEIEPGAVVSEYDVRVNNRMGIRFAAK